MRKMAILVAVLFAISKTAFAGIMVESSRVIYSAGDKERSLMLSNTNDYPVIVQTWIDDGAPNGTPETATNTPVIPLPGIFRLEPGEKKSLRLISTQLNQPKDRESLYWLNLYEIPPSDAHLPPGVQAIKVAVRLQLKLFYRPENISSLADELSGKLKFELQRKPGVMTLKVINPTAYYATFNAAEVTDGKRALPVVIGMMAPMSSKTIPVSSEGGLIPTEIHYTIINDDGNLISGDRDF